MKNCKFKHVNEAAAQVCIYTYEHAWLLCVCTCAKVGKLKED